MMSRGLRVRSPIMSRGCSEYEVGSGERYEAEM